MTEVAKFVLIAMRDYGKAMYKNTIRRQLAMDGVKNISSQQLDEAMARRYQERWPGSLAERRRVGDWGPLPERVETEPEKS